MCVFIGHTIFESLVKIQHFRIMSIMYKITKMLILVPRKTEWKIKNPSYRRSTTIIYLVFGKYFRPLHKLVKLEREHRRRQTKGRITELVCKHTHIHTYTHVHIDSYTHTYRKSFQLRDRGRNMTPMVFLLGNGSQK